jgi:hypothetical protein
VKAPQNIISRTNAQHAHPEELEYYARRLVADDAQELVMHPVLHATIHQCCWRRGEFPLDMGDPMSMGSALCLLEVLPMDMGTPCPWGVLPMGMGTPCPWGVLPMEYMGGTPHGVHGEYSPWTWGPSTPHRHGDRKTTVRGDLYYRKVTIS